MNTSTSFEALPLAAPLQRALRAKNYTHPSPIQEQAIPVLLEGRDLLGAAQTGTGKTAAFALPILQNIHENPARPERHRMRALVLTPTRELAVQVAKSFTDYGAHMKVTVETVYGGVSMSRQITAMKRGVDVLVATPGRLLDLRNQGEVDFGGVEFFVLDEADRMLDMGFINDIRKIIGELPARRQSLFFSATLSPEINELAHEILNNPAEIRLSPKVTTAEKIDHQLCYVGQENKLSLLQHLLNEQQDRGGRQLTLVFTRTKFRADKVAKALGREGFRAEAIHGNKTQAARQRALESFRKGRSPILVATDVAARGIDVKDVSLVVNFDMPDEPESYVHRIGRTARGGAAGTALTFCSEDNLKELMAVERLIKTEIPVYANHEFHIEKLGHIRTMAAKMTNGRGRNGSRPSFKKDRDRDRDGQNQARPGRSRSRFGKGGYQASPYSSDRPSFRDRGPKQDDTAAAPKARDFQNRPKRKPSRKIPTAVRNNGQPLAR